MCRFLSIEWNKFSCFDGETKRRMVLLRYSVSIKSESIDVFSILAMT